MKRLVAGVIAVGALGLGPVALATGTLSGAYQTKITGDPALGGALNGTWKITFTSGHYKVAHNGKSFGHGTDKVKGDKITLLNGANCSSTGKYTFKLTGKKLTFTKISDSCTGRRAVLTHGPFHKVS
jgi:hypothetical protein